MLLRHPHAQRRGDGSGCREPGGRRAGSTTDVAGARHDPPRGARRSGHRPHRTCRGDAEPEGRTMRIARYGDDRTDFWAAVDPDSGRVQVIQGEIQDWGPRVSAEGGGVLPLTGEDRDATGLRLLMPTQPGAKVVCLG